MALLLRAGGPHEDVRPANPKGFTLTELQTLVGGYIELAPANDADFLLVIDEEGKLKNKPVNEDATLLYKHGWHDSIVGDVLYMLRSEMDEEEGGDHDGN